uniref:Uncharacterized protein n=1 Tax=Neospora caninum (strain Liverpool) TaxID=572307 RepID=F0JBB0_NEOCL|nr:hypothetical protein, conserved [Neospora caninum Liverpool]CEL71377.1 TPA: hypothetical protein, conserved [Neospora caninum Liverpool]
MDPQGILEDPTAPTKANDAQGDFPSVCCSPRAPGPSGRKGLHGEREKRGHISNTECFLISTEELCMHIHEMELRGLVEPAAWLVDFLPRDRAAFAGLASPSSHLQPRECDSLPPQVFGAFAAAEQLLRAPAEDPEVRECMQRSPLLAFLHFYSSTMAHAQREASSLTGCGLRSFAQNRRSTSLPFLLPKGNPSVLENLAFDLTSWLSASQKRRKIRQASSSSASAPSSCCSSSVSASFSSVPVSSVPSSRRLSHTENWATPVSLRSRSDEADCGEGKRREKAEAAETRATDAPTCAVDEKSEHGMHRISQAASEAVNLEKDKLARDIERGESYLWWLLAVPAFGGFLRLSPGAAGESAELCLLERLRRLGRFPPVRRPRDARIFRLRFPRDLRRGPPHPHPLSRRGRRRARERSVDRKDPGRQRSRSAATRRRVTHTA